MKGKRLLILGAAFALGLSACANSATMVREAPLREATNGELTRATSDSGTILFSEKGLTNGVQYLTPFEIDDDTTITFAGGGNDGKYYTTGSGIRTYGGGSFTIASTRNILKISPTWDGGNKPDSDVANPTGYSASTNTWTGSAQSITFTRPSGSGHWRLQSITVYYVETGADPVPEVLEKTFAETLEAGKALDNGKSSFDYYKFECYVTEKHYGHTYSYWVTGSKGGSVSSDTAIQLYFAYNEPSAELANKLLKDTKLELTIILKNYNGTVEHDGAFTSEESINVLEAGTQWDVVPEPSVETKTIAEFLALPNSRSLAYSLTGTITAFKEGSTKDKYGNMTLSDATGTLPIYGSTLKADALAWDNESSYVFTNPQDFITNETTNALVIGAEVTMKLIRYDGSDTVRGAGVITSINVVIPEPTGIELTPTSLEVVSGKTAQISASILPAGASANVSWEIDDESIASIEAGSNNTVTVSGIEAGYAVVTAFIDENNNGAADANEINANCEVEVKAPVVPVGTKATMQYTGSTTTNMTEEGNASTVNLDDNVFVVSAGTGASTLLPGLNKAHDIRLYNNSEDDGSYFVVSATSGYTILSITIDFKSNPQHAKVYANETLVSGDSEYHYVINASSFKVQNGCVSSTSTQVQINSIDIYYQEPAADAVIANKPTHSSLSYDFTKTGGAVIDELNNGFIGVSGTSYSDWSGKTGASGAVYAGNSAGGNSSIQLRAEKNSGIVTTISGSHASKIIVSWHSSTANGRIIDVYGSNEAYTSAADLYSAETQGTKLGSISKGSTTLTINGEYEYIGIRSSSGALYLSSLNVYWGEPETYSFSKATIRFGGLLQKSLWDSLNANSKIAGYGVMFATENAVGSGELKDLTANNTTIFDRYTALTETKLNPTLATSEQKAGLVDADADYYVWNLCINMTAEQYFKDSFISVAYIQLENGNKVFMKQTLGTSVKSLATKMIADGVEDDGSLSYLAGL